MQLRSPPNPSLCFTATEQPVCSPELVIVSDSNYTGCKGYVNMVPPQHDLVVRDCDEALKLDINYIKALNRRAIALEGLERYEEALRGMPFVEAKFTL